MISPADFTVSLLGWRGASAPPAHPRRGPDRGTRRGDDRSCWADPVTVSGQISCPPAGSYVAVSGQDSVAAVMSDRMQFPARQRGGRASSTGPVSTSWLDAHHQTRCSTVRTCRRRRWTCCCHGMGSEWTSARGTGTRGAARRVAAPWLTSPERTRGPSPDAVTASTSYAPPPAPPAPPAACHSTGSGSLPSPPPPETGCHLLLQQTCVRAARVGLRLFRRRASAVGGAPCPSQPDLGRRIHRHGQREAGRVRTPGLGRRVPRLRPGHHRAPRPPGPRHRSGSGARRRRRGPQGRLHVATRRLHTTAGPVLPRRLRLPAPRSGSARPLPVGDPHASVAGVGALPPGCLGCSLGA